MLDSTNLPTFIRDTAATEDAFGSHGRIANAISAIIRSSQQIRTLGLLGRWGSGKSTILRMLERELSKTDSPDVATHIFFYDAWLHQSDPPRRSFLESFIEFLVKQGMTTKKEWNSEVDRLNRRSEEHDIKTTPTLTASGKVIGASLLLFPIGLQLIGKDWIGKNIDLGIEAIPVTWVGIAMLVAPVFAAIVVYVLWRPTYNIFSQRFWRTENWTTHRPPHDESTIFSLFMNKAVDRVHNRIIRTPDPTAIEFQETFQKIMQRVAAPNRRFVFVIDNLDRIPEAEAIAMWSTVRSFFLDASDIPVDKGDFGTPYVILPIDPGSIRRIYATNHGDEQADELAKSFIDKTFDLTFRLGPPILSDWAEYLGKMMRHVFGARADDQRIYIISKLYERYLTEKRSDEDAQGVRDATPRMINSLVNEVAVLDLQWGEQIKFATIAYYAINKDRIETDVRSILHADARDLQHFDADWATGIAAIYYGVPTDRALQVFMEPQVRAAIRDATPDEFARLNAVKGFFSVLDRIVDSETVDNANPEFITNTAYLLGTLNTTQGAWLPEIQRKLRSGLRTATPWRTIATTTASGMVTLIENAPSGERQSVYHALTRSMSLAVEEFCHHPDADKIWISAAKTLHSYASEQQLSTDSITVPGTATFYLQVVSRAADNDQLLATLSPMEGASNVMSAFAEMAEKDHFGEWTRTTLQALLGIRSWTWAPVTASAGKFIREQPLDNAQTAGALRVLGILRKAADQSARDEVARLSQEGHLFDKLFNARQSNAFDAEAATLALLILVNPNFNLEGRHGHATNGYNLMQNPLQAVDGRPQVLKALSEFLSEFATFKELINCSLGNGKTAPVTSRVFAHRLDTKTVGRLHVDDVLARLQDYLGFLDESHQEKFIELIPAYETFWEKLPKAPFSDALGSLMHKLLDIEGEGSQLARAEVMRRASELSSDKWAQALRENKEPVNLLRSAIATGSDTLENGEGLLQALVTSFSEVLDGSNAAGAEQLQIWAECLKAISQNAQETFFKSLRDEIFRPGKTARLLDVLVSLGPTLLADGQFGRRADEAVRYVVLPLLTDLPRGPEWLQQNTDEVRSWIRDCDPGTRGHVSEQLNSASTNGDHGSLLASLAESWDIEAPVRNPPAEDSAD